MWKKSSEVSFQHSSATVNKSTKKRFLKSLAGMDESNLYNRGGGKLFTKHMVTMK